RRLHAYHDHCNRAGDVERRSRARAWSWHRAAPHRCLCECGSLDRAACRRAIRRCMMRARVNSLPLKLDRVGFSAGGVEILRDVSLAIDSGAPTIVLGPNGAGKSVMLRLCHGLRAPTHGWIRTGDVAVSMERTALVFQRPIMLRRSVLANVMYAADGKDKRACAALLLERVGLSH